MQGKLIIIDGPDGSGKTTQVKRLVEYLSLQGFKVKTFREPGGTVPGEHIREILLRDDMAPITELLLFTAARMENITENILPNLEAGYVVIMDRFIDSTYAYQGHGRGLIDETIVLEQLVLSKVVPDYTLFLDVPVEVSVDRIDRRMGQTKDRLDSLDLETKQRIVDGFKLRANYEKGNTFTIDASRSIDEVTESIDDWAEIVFIPANHELITKQQGTQNV